jgi:hypothetical protein
MKDKNKKTKDMDGKKKKEQKKKEYLLEKKIVRLLILDNSQPAIRKGGGLYKLL